MLICRNAEGVHGKKKVGNPYSRQIMKTLGWTTCGPTGWT